MASTIRLVADRRQLGVLDKRAYLLDLGRVVKAEGQALQMTEGVARLNDGRERERTAAEGDFGALDNGNGAGVARLAEVKADEMNWG